MRICLVGRRDSATNPDTLHLAASLKIAGHEVDLVCGGRSHEKHTFPGEVHWVPARRPAGAGPAGWLLRRLQPPGLRDLVLRRSLAGAARATGASLFYPLVAGDVEVAAAAAGAAGAVFRAPHWPSAGHRDIVDMAPHDPMWGSPAIETPSGVGRLHPDRHRGRKITIAYRRTGQNPGRYLESALRRSGADVSTVYDHLDWSTINPGTSAVVIVESPLPRLQMSGVNPGIPTLFWVHHGEHHLEANLRLVRQYQADAVLLAHSWHLAHRFPVATHRFPFAIPSELFGTAPRWEDRRYDVAMVGSGLQSRGGRYRRRGDLVTLFEGQPDLSIRFASGVSPAALADIYADARIVLNEGGDRHHPITMRAFEALGAGAFLLTDKQPGLDTLLSPVRHYGLLRSDPLTQVRRLLADPATPDIAGAGHEYAMARHTYDHRVDALFAVIDRTNRLLHQPIRPAGLADAVDEDVEVDTLIDLGGPGRAPLPPDRIVLDADGQGQADGVIARRPGHPEDVARALRLARRYVYVSSDLAASFTEDHLAAAAGDASIEAVEGGLRIDLGAPGYRIRPQRGNVT